MNWYFTIEGGEGYLSVKHDSALYLTEEEAGKKQVKGNLSRLDDLNTAFLLAKPRCTSVLPLQTVQHTQHGKAYLCFVPPPRLPFIS